jgi:NADH-quinone oxidoreductase subunit J
MHDYFIQVVFYGLAVIAILSALMVITQNNPVRCVLFLVVTFFASAVLWMMALAEFLALILVLVYVGAVMTLFLFVVMMLNIDTESIKTHMIRYLPFGLILVTLLVGLLLVAVPVNSFKNGVENSVVAQAERAVSLKQEVKVSNTEEIGLALYTDYVFAFEIAAVLLLVAIVSAITLAQREAIRAKKQSIIKQLMTRPSDRIELVKMKPEI